ncbi:MAG TPA: trypsin-like peptidase domain-containing protein [Thermoanaerobaculia bacterium]|nr:trypsin-like peptidase domain-containing protein [Thermoanaerobaculia bacterium]
MKRIVVLSLVIVCIAAAATAAGRIDPAISRESVGMKSYPAPPRLAAAANIAPAVIAGPADTASIAEVHAWNAEGRLPFQNGFTRVLPELISVRLTGTVSSKGGPAAHAGGVVAMSERGIVWSGKFQIDAHRVRLRLDNVRLPAGAVLWVYNDAGKPIAFDSDLLDPDGGIWAPSVRGGVIHLEIETPMPKSEAEAASFDINRFVELIALEAVKPQGAIDDTSCLRDVQCESASFLHQYKTGVAYLEYIKNGGGYVCSGGLMNDVDTTTVTPWFLTANHCLSTQAAATTLEAYFDWRYLSCVSTNAPLPEPMRGSTLIATNASSDFTFLRLSQITGTHWYFGSDPNIPAAGTTLHRISHPAPDTDGDGFGNPQPQQYSASTLSATVPTCTGAGRPDFIYSTFTAGQGGIYGGSSGSPVFLSTGHIVGQLLGFCGTASTINLGCDTSNKIVDGALATTWTSISPFLLGSGTTPPPCVPTQTALCLNNDRFKVEATFQTGAGQSGQANVFKLTNDTGYFWFFSSTNVEAVVKVLDACSFNQRFWVFAGGLTDVQVNVTLTDTKTGSVRTYFNPQGKPFQPIQDTSAFATCP